VSSAVGDDSHQFSHQQQGLTDNNVYKGTGSISCNGQQSGLAVSRVQPQGRGLLVRSQRLKLFICHYEECMMHMWCYACNLREGAWFAAAPPLLLFSCAVYCMQSASSSLEKLAAFASASSHTCVVATSNVCQLPMYTCDATGPVPQHLHISAMHAKACTHARYISSRLTHCAAWATAESSFHCNQQEVNTHQATPTTKLITAPDRPQPHAADETTAAAPSCTAPAAPPPPPGSLPTYRACCSSCSSKLLGKPADLCCCLPSSGLLLKLANMLQ
jgi:hypothetical protein